jgi:hypothetical protein
MDPCHIFQSSYLRHFRDLPYLLLFFTIQHHCAILFSKPGGVQKIIILQYYSHIVTGAKRA